jgi:UDP-N-acetylglucosamine 2-epimerase (non-hydrolysing)/GDP/UDP-N,N'-diacetylbacillosamine 2-epimerase (hydrolysing)
MAKRKICVVSGSRSDYGLLSVVMKEIKDNPAFTLQVVATGMHLAPEFGLTYREIEKDGFSIDAQVEMLLSSDTPVGITKSLGIGLIGFADALHTLKPDLLMLLGDRFEILAAAEAALVAKIPIAHIAGGDTTEGAFDEAIRHSITKMSHLHFVTNEASARRVRQLGENPEHIFTVGSPGVDVIQRVTLIDRKTLEAKLGFTFRKLNLLVTFHPATLDSQSAGVQFTELLSALDTLGNNTGIIFTMPNADTDGRVIISMIEDYSASRPHAKAYASLGQVRYLSAMAEVDVVVGNSSSGLYETPSFKKPTINIGDRQKGRLQASSIINCKPESADIVRAIKEALTKDCSNTVNPYGNGDSAQKIVALLKSIPDFNTLLKKHFYNIA